MAGISPPLLFYTSALHAPQPYNLITNFGGFAGVAAVL